VTWDHVADPARFVEAAFRAIQTQRMQGVPILNPALRVEAIGFTPWRGRWLGLLITPWCMNLMLLPEQMSAWTSIAAQERLFYEFPAGTFAFLGGHEPELGEYHSCALYSPMAEFADQASARAVGHAALAALMIPLAAADDADKVAEAPAPPEPAAAMSKREFFGRILPRINS